MENPAAPGGRDVPVTTEVTVRLGVTRALDCYLKPASNSEGVLCVGLTPVSPYSASESASAPLREGGHTVSEPLRIPTCLCPSQHKASLSCLPELC